MIAVQPLAAQVGVAPACQALGVSRASFYRRQRSTPGHQQPRPTPARALCEAEREQILDVLAGPRFVDRAPAEVVATLLDEGSSHFARFIDKVNAEGKGLVQIKYLGGAPKAPGCSNL